MVYGTYNYSYTGAFVNQLITGGPHIASMGDPQARWLALRGKAQSNSWMMI